MNELEKKPSAQESFVVSKENLPQWLDKVAFLREQPGKEREALKLVRSVRGEAILLGEHESVINLFWEEYLSGKHLVMSVRDKHGLWNLPLKVKGILEGFLLMQNSANKADKYIDKHHVESCKPRSGRFLGEIASFKKQYPEAVKRYSESIELYEKMEDNNQRVNALEISGFLAEVLIRSGKSEQGIELAKKTFAAYDVNEGAELKKKDYYTWAVWKSGCIIKAWHGILAKNISLNEPIKEELVNMLYSAEKVLIIPEGQKTWGDKNFEFRKNEIKAIRKSAGI